MGYNASKSDKESAPQGMGGGAEAASVQVDSVAVTWVVKQDANTSDHERTMQAWTDRQ
jgi:hypothetical protein